MLQARLFAVPRHRDAPALAGHGLEPMTTAMHRLAGRRFAELWWLVVAALAYALLSKVVLALFSVDRLLTMFWPSAGIALAAVLLGGRRFLPAIYAGAFLGLFWSDGGAAPAALIAIGSTLEPLLGRWLLARGRAFDSSLRSTGDFFRLCLLAGGISPIVSAVIGTATLYGTGRIAADHFWHHLAHWWMGDALGIAIVAPVILVWRTPPRLRVERIPEAAALLALAFFAGQVVFRDWFASLFEPAHRGYWMYLIVSWSAVRLGLHGVLFVIVLAIVQAMTGIAQGTGVFANDLEATHLLDFWVFAAILTTVGISLAISFSERDAALTELLASKDRYRSLFENMIDGLAHGRVVFAGATAVDCEFIAVNPAFERLSGLSGIVGRRLAEFLPDFAGKHPETLADLARAVQTGEPSRRVIHGRQPGQWLAMAVYRPAPGEFIAVLEDVSERVQAEHEVRKLSQAVEQSPVSIVITDRDGCIEYVNPAFSAISGYTAAEAIGRNPRLLQSGLTERKTYEELWSTLAAGKAWHGDFINRRKDGTHYFETATISPVRQPDGSISHYVAVKEDTSELKRVIADLRASEDRLRMAKTAARLGIFDSNLVSGILTWDERMREIWGFRADETVTLDSFLAGLHAADRAPTRAALDRAFDPAGGGEYRAEYRVVHRGDGNVRHVAATGQVFFRDGHAVRLVGTARDVSDEKRLQREIRERRGAMEVMVNQQVAAQTAAAIAHELNQPLVAVSAYSEAAARMFAAGSKEPEKLAHALRGAVNQAQRAGRTLHELLEFLHQGESRREAMDLNEIVREAVAFAEEGGYGNVQSALELEPGLRPVLANRVQIQKVLVNLLHNSIEAMQGDPAAPGEVQIRVRTNETRNMAQVTVRDSGPGLDAIMAERIFEPFYTTKPEGIGLGLAISRALVEAHGGQLWADLDGGPGMTVHFVLPFAS
jgi:two-component system sensor kinase FixL